MGVGARAAGYRHLWGIEHRADVARVAEANGFRSIVADVRNVDPHTLEHPYALHASPPCKEASGANGERIENEEGREIGQVIARFIKVLHPTVFTLENVYYYRTFDSFSYITDQLFSLGYMVDWDHLNAADFGVPQTRMRLILRAVRGSLLPILPEPEPWIGWYEAIEDLIPTLPESQFAPWQLERLPDSIGTLLVDRQNASHETMTSRMADEPAFTVTDASQGGGTLSRAFLVDSAGYPQGNGRVPVCRKVAEPANIIVANHAKRPMRAFLVGSHYAQPNTVEDRRVQVRDADEPCFTITAGYNGDKRAWLTSGRVVQLTPRALARLQSIPDDYVLPESKVLACYVIGNAVPPLMYQKIIGQFQAH